MRILRRILRAVLLAALFLAALITARMAVGLEGYDPYRIDYDRPGVDITSEGP